MAYRCCCGLFSITTGAQILATFEVINVIGGMFLGNSIHGSTTAFYSGLGFGGVISLIAAILVFVACSKQQAGLMLPMIVLEAILLFIKVIAFGCFVYVLCDKEAMAEFTNKFNATGKQGGNVDLSKEEIARNQLIGLTVGVGIWVAFSIWYLTVFRNCYKHLKEQQRARNINQHGI